MVIGYWENSRPSSKFRLETTVGGNATATRSTLDSARSVERFSADSLRAWP